MPALEHSRADWLVGLGVGHVTWSEDGPTLPPEPSSTDKDGDGAEIAIPRGQVDDTCPLTALNAWLERAEITTGPRCREVSRGLMVETTRLSTDAVCQKFSLTLPRKGSACPTVSPPEQPGIPLVPGWADAEDDSLTPRPRDGSIRRQAGSVDARHKAKSGREATK